jgi:hypothetical protein
VGKLCFVLIISLLPIILIGCGSNGNLAGSTATTKTELLTKKTGLNDIDWLNVVYRKVEAGKNYPVTVSLNKHDNPELIEILERALAQGSYENASMPSVTETSLSIKLSNGKYIQTPFSGQIFLHPKSDLAEYVGATGLLITPTSDFRDLINKLIDGQIKTKSGPKAEQKGAVIRNKKVDLERVNLSAYSEDPIFRSFSWGKGRSLTDYETETLQQGKKEGIDPEKLSGALEVAKNKIGSGINKVPVIIETVRYNGTDSYLFAFAWEISMPDMDRLGHIWVMVIEEGSNQVLSSDHCS